ncbi:serine hydrolase domain-containing protein [Streptomyces antimicrobicus]|uniref:Beta-lactamase family protein n=1 Tax=Streptomyces antimicrobicus TaxID=2883108 RepID=A0ABS8BB22_9ACTN|nr:serine hydrolase domain-containing protein [Streptomyces antimicrobicus]MCB5181748.1 beta-lactamase family protein [Streptomyces antimicrobicus]
MTKSPKTYGRWIAAVAAGAALLGVSAAAVPSARAAERPVTGTVREPIDPARLRAALGALPDGVLAGAMARVGGRDGRWTGAAGNVSADPAASFRIGSITKLFTSTLTLQLIAEGRLTMDTPVQQVLPGTLPAHWAPITIEQLLSHTSGLPRPACYEQGRSYTPAEFIRSAITECPQAGEPVTGDAITQIYMGANYHLLGMVVEKVTGRTYAEELNRRIVRPLGLRHTYLPAAGDTSMPSPALADLPPADPWAWAEGGMVSNAPDLERFLTSLLRGRLLPPAQQKLLFEMPSHAERGFSRAGVQYYKLPDGTEVWGKTGSYGGYVNGAFATRDLRRSLVYSLVPVTEDQKKIETRYFALADAAF